MSVPQCGTPERPRFRPTRICVSSASKVVLMSPDQGMAPRRCGKVGVAVIQQIALALRLREMRRARMQDGILVAEKPEVLRAQPAQDHRGVGEELRVELEMADAAVQSLGIAVGRQENQG